MNEMGVYQIRNLINNKVYIGSTATSFNRKWTGHKYSLNKNIHHSRHLQGAWNKYGKDNFLFEVLLTFDKSEMSLIREAEQSALEDKQSYLREYGYNIAREVRGTAPMGGALMSAIFL